MAGRSLEAAFPHVPHEPGEVVLELEDVSGPRLPRGAGLRLRKGEILGIAGLVGAGRTELLRALFGLDPVRHGRVRVAAAWDRGRPPWERLTQGVGLLSENRKEEGLARPLSISDNLTLSRPIARFGVISRQATIAPRPPWRSNWVFAIVTDGNRSASCPGQSAEGRIGPAAAS
jgi:ribose transport system ATP-binding protein